MTTREKTCIFCKRDCSDRDRVVDERGRYACKVCLEAAKRIREMSYREASDASASNASQPMAGSGGHAAASSDATQSINPDATAEATAIDELRAAVEELRAAIQPGQNPGHTPGQHADQSQGSRGGADLLPDDDDTLPPLLAESPNAESSDAAFPPHDTCPACGGAIPPFALLCDHCGTDTQTGERVHGADDQDEANSGGSSAADTDVSDDGSADADTDGTEAEPLKARRPTLRDLGITWGHLLAVFATLLTGGAWILLRADLGVPLHRFGLFVGVAVGLGMYLGHGRRSLDAPQFAIAITLLGVFIGVVGSGLVAVQQRRFDASQYTDEHKGLATLADEIVTRGAAHAGLTWHFARPPRGA